MRTSVAVSVVVSSFVVVAACAHKDDTSQATAPTATATYGAYPGYPTAPGQPPPPGYPTAGGYPTATGYPPGGYPTATAPATAYPPQPTAPAATGTMAVPGPLALPCQNDAQCGLHHCNTQYGKCAFPCATAADCLAPNNCFVGVCLPAPPSGH
jgi:hypothetical protein